MSKRRPHTDPHPVRLYAGPTLELGQPNESAVRATVPAGCPNVDPDGWQLWYIDDFVADPDTSPENWQGPYNPDNDNGQQAYWLDVYSSYYTYVARFKVDGRWSAWTIALES